MNPAASKGIFQGETAVWLKAGPYEAAILPGVGANLIAFRDITTGYQFIREPKLEEMDSFKARPMVHGIPILFPPNRYDGGQFEIEGVKYNFPINEPDRGNHLHGLCYDQSWETVETGQDEEESFALFTFTRFESDSSYSWFPHHFRIAVLYALSAAGLRLQITVYNLSDKPMPCMLGFHTAVNAPFAQGSTADDITFSMTIGNRWELNNRMLPTGHTQPLSEFEQSFKQEERGASPFTEPMDNHYNAVPGTGGNRMIITDRREGVRFIYDAGLGYKQWMIWNNGAAGRFFCPEPQINMVNAPNLSLPPDQTGLVLLQPGESWSETSRLHAENI